MSRSPEAPLTAPSLALTRDSQFLSEAAGHQLINPYLRMLEGQILFLQGSMEATGVAKELHGFNSLKHSRVQADQDLYFGTPETYGSKVIVMANGFTPFNPLLENPFVAPYLEFWQNVFPPLKSNAILEEKRLWYERHGHKADFAFDTPNHIWFKNYMDTYNAVVDAIADSDCDGRDIWVDGLSAGGMIGEMVLKKLAKKGYAINLITNGSPEVNEKMLELFDSSIERSGIMGQVHKAALKSQEFDLDYERMGDEVHEAATSDFHPDSQVVRFYSDDDNICPPPNDPNAIQVNGVHTAIPYRKQVLQYEELLLADASSSKSLAA